MATSQSPSAIACAADTMACRPEPHRRLTLKAGVSTGQPASMAATRERYASFVSVGITLPITTWPTASAAMPLRSMAARTAVVASWVLGMSLSEPPKVPMAVRAMEAMRMSRCAEVMEVSGGTRGRDARPGPLRVMASGISHCTARSCREGDARRSVHARQIIQDRTVRPPVPPGSSPPAAAASAAWPAWRRCGGPGRRCGPGRCA